MFSRIRTQAAALLATAIAPLYAQRRATYHRSVRDCLVDHVMHVGLLVRLRCKEILHAERALALRNRRAYLEQSAKPNRVCSREDRGGPSAYTVDQRQPAVKPHFARIELEVEAEPADVVLVRQLSIKYAR
jgi:hypothetical protein